MAKELAFVDSVWLKKISLRRLYILSVIDIICSVSYISIQCFRFSKKMESKGRHFVLHLVKFVFEVVGKRSIPGEIQTLLNAYGPDEKSQFSGSIMKVVIISITDYMDRVNDLKSIMSPKFKDDLNSIGNNEDFLEFVGKYSVKVLADFSNNTLKSPYTFVRLITSFLMNINVNEGSVSDYFEKLNQSAELIIVKHLLRPKDKSRNLNDGIDPAQEKRFIVDLMNCVFSLFDAREEIKLKHENLQNLVTANISKALKLIVHHHEQFLLIGVSELKDYFYNRCVKAFNEKDFLELCVCCARNVVLGHSVDISLESSENACDLLLEVIHCAKIEGKFTTFAEMHVAARELKSTFEGLYPQFAD